MQSAVGLVRCASYEAGDLEAALDRALDLTGGLARCVSRGDRVLVKPNFICGRVAGRRPAQTDARLIAAVLERLLDLGAKPIVSDSTAWGSLASVASWVGLVPLARRLGVPIVEMGPSRHVPLRSSKVYRALAIGRTALEADRIINLPKFKAHGQLYLTVAVKNMFGCVVGRRKAVWHFHAGDEANYFAWMLLELWQAITPALTIVDGITAMQGQGPSAGDPYALRTLLVGTDGVAIDRVGCELVNGFPGKMRTLAAAEDLGIGQPDLERIALVGDSLSDLRVTDFRFARMGPIGFTFPRLIKGAVKQSWLASVGR